MQIIYKNKLINYDNTTVKNYGISDGDTIIIIVKLL